MPQQDSSAPEKLKMFENVLSFIDRHQSFILTTHDSPDADGLGAQIVFAAILKKLGKSSRLINNDPVPAHLGFIDNLRLVENWNAEKHRPLLRDAALIILDTAAEYHIGSMSEALKTVKEAFTFDHHEPVPWPKLPGFNDPAAASTSELAIELACYMGIELDAQTATAAYAGIVYDSGFFAHPKTSLRTFRAAMTALEWGADPNYIYRQLMESASYQALLLQKQALSNLEFYAGKQIALLTLSKEDFEMIGAGFEDAENIVNIPLKVGEVEVSVLIKEKPDGEVRCSLRSKGRVNVSKVAQEFGGGGHTTAAGFKSSSGMEEILNKLLADVEARLNSV